MSCPSSTVEATGVMSALRARLGPDAILTRDAGQRDHVMQVSRRRDRDRLDAFGEQFIDFGECAAPGKRDGSRAMLLQWIDDADQRHPGQTGQHTGMVAAHHARADDAYAQRAFCIGRCARYGLSGTHLNRPQQNCARKHPRRSLARRHKRGECHRPFPDTF